MTLEPTSGGSKKTTSPRASCANQVIPNVAVSAVEAHPVVLGVVQQVVGVRGLGHLAALLGSVQGLASPRARGASCRGRRSRSRCPARPCRPARRPCRCRPPGTGSCVPLVTTPPPTTSLPCRAMPGPVMTNGASFSRRAGLARGAHGVAADEARVLLAAPAQAGLDRAALLHQVVAVEVEADLEAQRVARGEADGRRRRASSERVPERARRPAGRSSSTPSSPV